MLIKSKFPLFIIIPATLFSALFMFLNCHATLAGEYYVSPNGNETWPNCTSPDNPCRASNIDKDFLNAEAGDTIYFLDGTYSGLTYSESSYRTPSWNPVNSGTSSNPIIFKSFNDKGAHLIGLQTEPRERVPMIGGYYRNYIVWDGFILSAVDWNGNPQMAGVNFYNVTGGTVKNCEIRGASHNTGGDINYEGVRTEDSINITVENCYIHGFIETENNRNTSGFKSYRVNNLTIKNCVFENNNGSGIFLKGSPHKGVLIENNFLHNNYRGLDIVQSSGESNDGVVLRNNVFSGNSYLNIEFTQDTDAKMDNTFVYNNTFVGTNGFVWGPAETGKGPTIYNNIFYNLSGGDVGQLLMSRWNIAAPALAEDHSRLDFTARIELRRGGSNVTYYNNLGSWQASGELYGGGNPGLNSITADPFFVNSSGTMSQLRVCQ
jgi:parallel beta-helix repeat protein